MSNALSTYYNHLAGPLDNQIKSLELQRDDYLDDVRKSGDENMMNYQIDLAKSGGLFWDKGGWQQRIGTFPNLGPLHKEIYPELNLQEREWLVNLMQQKVNANYMALGLQKLIYDIKIQNLKEENGGSSSQNDNTVTSGDDRIYVGGMDMEELPTQQTTTPQTNETEGFNHKTIGIIAGSLIVVGATAYMLFKKEE